MLEKSTGRKKGQLAFLFDLLLYCHAICLEKVEEKTIDKIECCLQSQGWNSSCKTVTNVKDFVDTFKLAGSLQLYDFSEELRNWLFKKIKNNEVKNVEEKQFISEELEKYDKDLAVEFSQKKSVALTSERFRNVLSSFDCQNYPKIVKAELELLKEKGLLDKITFCSYRAVICKLNTLPNLGAAAESKCCEVFQILKEGGFVIHDEFSRDWDSWVSLTESGLLHSAAESGLVEIVKFLLKLRADPLSIVGKYRGNDETVIHAIHRKLCRTEI